MGLGPDVSLTPICEPELKSVMLSDSDEPSACVVSHTASVWIHCGGLSIAYSTRKALLVWSGARPHAAKETRTSVNEHATKASYWKADAYGTSLGATARMTLTTGGSRPPATTSALPCESR